LRRVHRPGAARVSATATPASTSIDRMEIDADGFIKPIRITHEGVPPRPLN
jgi:hypothetical protein